MQNSQNISQSKPQFLSGSYRLHVAPISFTLALESITFTLIQTYTLKLLTEGTSLPKSVGVSVATQPFSHKLHASSHSEQKRYIKFVQPIPNEAIAEQDKEIVELIQSVESYQWAGGMLRMYGSSNMLWFRGRRPHDKQQHKNEGPYGQWSMELVNLALEVSDRHFVFEGINNVRYLLTYEASSDGQISFELQTQQQIKKTEKTASSPAKIDFDVIFINALLRSASFKKGQVSFELFNDKGNLTAKGTPYM